MELTNGGWRAKIVADSISEDGVRLTTMEVRFPRIVLAEFNTHRMFSRNSASSRAIPIDKMLKMIEDDPFEPTYWGANQKGMQAEGEVDESSRGGALIEWKLAKRDAIRHVEHLNRLGIHKQLANRLLEPFMWHTVVVTATEWDNFFGLRCHEAAAPEIRNVAILMRDLYEAHADQAVPLNHADWHLPYWTKEDDELVKHMPPFWVSDEAIEHAKKVSVARCARVSYLTQNGTRDHEADIALYDRLLENRHMSPFEHVASPMDLDWEYPEDWWSGNFKGWHQFRKEIVFEDNATSFQNWNLNRENGEA